MSGMGKGGMDKGRVARYFKKSLHTYDQHAVVQQQAARNLVSSLKEVNQSPYTTVFEAGCCTGILTCELLKEVDAEYYYLNDLVEDFGEIVLDKLGGDAKTKIEPTFGDIEQIELPEEIDLFISSSTLQWLDDVPATLLNICQKLNQKGQLAISFFTQGTLAELTDFTGSALQYADRAAMVKSLSAYMDILVNEVREYTLYFQEELDVLRHVQQTGVGGVDEFRWNKKKLLEYKQYYSQLRVKDEGLPLTYVNAEIIAIKR